MQEVFIIKSVRNRNSSGADRHGTSSEVVCASLGQIKIQKKLLVHVMQVEVLQVNVNSAWGNNQ
jgi:hypothetical protein